MKQYRNKGVGWEFNRSRKYPIGTLVRIAQKGSKWYGMHGIVVDTYVTITSRGYRNPAFRVRIDGTDIVVVTQQVKLLEV